jgi:integrase
MKLIDKETVDGTSVVIGRKVQYRRTAQGGREERVSATYTAVYKDADGNRRFEGLGVTTKREARRKAIEIQQRIDDGRIRRKRTRLRIDDLIERYTAYNESKGLAPKSLAKYAADLEKLSRFCKEHGIERADRFGEEEFHAFGAWLRRSKHKQGEVYRSKTVSTCLTLTKQAFKFGWRTGLLPECQLAPVRVPAGRARVQPCYTEAQIERMLELTEGTTHAAIAILAYSGLRIGELEALRWRDIQFDRGELGVIHVRSGGSAGSPKDKEPRMIPISPRIRPLLESLPRDHDLVLPELRARTLLTQVKKVARAAGVTGRVTVHGFRHSFASTCAAKGLPYRIILSFMGHADSAILEHYVQLEDDASHAAMRALSERHGR